MTKNTDGSDCTDLAGYRVYYSQTSPVTKSATRVEVPVASLTDPNNPLIEITDLVAGKTYFFRLSAYNLSGDESPISVEEVHKDIP